MITEVDDFFTKGCGRCARFEMPDCAVQQWRGGLIALRRICLDAGLVEEVKWAHPCYTHKGRNIAMMGAFRGDFRLNFMNPALLKDPQGVLEKPGPNSQNASMLRFTSDRQVSEMEATIIAYLREAMSYADAGIKPPKEAREIELPEELLEALDGDPEMAEAFHDLTPGRQRSYVIALNTAKKPETRTARIAKFRNRILAGKGATEL